MLGDFCIRDKIGTGTQGTVYRAHQTSRNRPVALKVLAGTAGRGTPVARFVREAEILARLDHPGIVRGYGVGEEHGFHYFAMEYVDGPDAATWLRRVGGRLPPAGALYLTLGCAAALAHAAGRSVVHRDVKPANILVGRGGAVKVTDWGLAKPTDADHALTGTHTGMGTLQYVAPEQVRDARRADHRSDIYALGGVLYELLTGRVPFPGSNWLEVLRAKERAAFPAARLLNPAVPRPCDVVLARMLAPDPDGRYPGYDDLIADLKGLAPTGDRPEGLALGGRPAGARPLAACGPPLRVLLVYDEADYVPLVQHALHAAGVPHTLTVAEDGHAARGAGRPDVLILGLTSPTRTSVRLLAEVRKDAGPGRLRVCGLSTTPEGADLLRTLDPGIALWATGFGDLEPLSAFVRDRYAGLFERRDPPA